MRRGIIAAWLMASFVCFSGAVMADEAVLMPTVAGPVWQVAGSPDLASDFAGAATG